MFLIIDQGTTSTKVMLFNLEGKKVDSSQKPFKQIFPNNGWVEHNPEEIIETVISCCNEVIDNNSDQNICSIGITNQRETVVLWDKTTGKSLYNAIVWQDRRTDTYCNELKVKGYEEFINQKTGLLKLDLKAAKVWKDKGRSEFQLRQGKKIWQTFITDGDGMAVMQLPIGKYYLRVGAFLEKTFFLGKDKELKLNIR